MKSRRRSLRRSLKDKKLTPAKRRALRDQLRESILKEG